jgi:tetratricopeptide (TPR) repeat protein
VAINRTIQGAAEVTSMWPRISSAFAALQQNHLAEAERRFRRVADFLGDQDLYRSYRNSAQIGLGLVALAQGELTTAQKELDQALADPVNLYPYIYVQGLLGLAALADQQGRREECCQLLQRTLAYAGERSLVEEYGDTLLAIAHSQRPDAPVQSLARALLAYAEPRQLTAVVEKLQTITG